MACLNTHMFSEDNYMRMILYLESFFFHFFLFFLAVFGNSVEGDVNRLRSHQEAAVLESLLLHCWITEKYSEDI